jgi:hypothetical protein
MADSKSKYGYNPDPRLSANQLAEYLNAAAPRRKQIVRDAKYPKKSVVAQYDSAWTAITKYLCDNSRPPSILLEAISKQKEREAKPTATPWVKRDARLSAEAMQAFQKSYNTLGLATLICKPIALVQPTLKIAGVEVSVSLDATTHAAAKKTEEPLVGGLLLLFSKSEASANAREDRCRTSALLATLFAEQHLKGNGTADPKLGLSLDVFEGKLYRTPGSYVKRLNRLQISCEEVVLRWAGTPKPDDYDGPPH